MNEYSGSKEIQPASEDKASNSTQVDYHRLRASCVRRDIDSLPIFNAQQLGLARALALLADGLLVAIKYLGGRAVPTEFLYLIVPQPD